MRAITGSQWRSVSRGVTWECLGTLNTRRAPPFWISCKGLIADARQASQQSVAVIHTRQDHCLNKEAELSRLWGMDEFSWMLYRKNPHARVTRSDVLREGQPVVHHHSKVFCTVAWGGLWCPLCEMGKIKRRERLELEWRLALSYLGWVLDSGCPSISGCLSGRQRDLCIRWGKWKKELDVISITVAWHTISRDDGAKGPRTEPWGTPVTRGQGADTFPAQVSWKEWPER